MLGYNYNKYTTYNYALAKYKNLQYKKKYLSKSIVLSKHWNFVKSTFPVKVKCTVQCYQSQNSYTVEHLAWEVLDC